MEWKLTKEGGRPLHEDQMKWDKEKQEAVLVVPQKKKYIVYVSIRTTQPRLF